MSTVFILSILVSIFSLGLTLIGLPAQILKNHREKRSGQPLLTILIAFGFYASQIALFAVTHTYLPLISFIIGLVMWCIIFAQHRLYRNNTPV